MVPEATKMEPKGCPRRPKWSQVGTKTSQGDPEGSPSAKRSEKGSGSQVQLLTDFGSHFGKIQNALKKQKKRLQKIIKKTMPKK